MLGGVDVNARETPEFTVEPTPDGWCAPHKTDRSLIYESASWKALLSRCSTARTVRTLRRTWQSERR